MKKVNLVFPLETIIPNGSYNADNDDALNERYGAPGTRATGMYQPGSGIGGALLCFTGPEYMHMVLR